MAGPERNMAESTPGIGEGSPAAVATATVPSIEQGAANQAVQAPVNINLPGFQPDSLQSQHIGEGIDIKLPPLSANVNIPVDPDEEMDLVEISSGVFVPVDDPRARRLETGGGGGGDAGGTGEGGGPKGPGRPESSQGPEWESSPEYGRMLVEQIVYMETKMSYDDRYNERNEPILNRAYEALRKFVEGEQEHRNDRAPFNPREGHPEVEQEPNETLLKAIIRTYKEKITKGVGKAKQEAQRQPEDFTNVEALNVLIAKYKSLDTTPDQREALKEPLLKYFREAERKGLLRGMNEVFNSLYLAYTNRSIPQDRIRQFLYEKTVIGVTPNIPEAYIAGESAYRRKMGDREVNSRLREVWDVYIEWTRQRFESILDSEDNGVYKEGEWKPPTKKEDLGVEKTYWEPYAGYPDYYTVTAKIPTQFRIAKESFLRMLKNHTLGYAPDELMSNLINFKKIFSREATRLADEQKALPDGPNKMTVEFAEELRQEFEGEGFIWGADYNGEVYNREGQKQFMMAMALHEGPQRWARLVRSGEGLVGVHTYWLDNDKIVGLAYNAQGSRGQLGGNSVAQNYLRQTIIEMLIERGVGVVLKDYDPRDQEWASSDTTEVAEARKLRALKLHQIEEHLKGNNYDLESLDADDKIFYQEVKKFLRTNREFIGLHNSGEEFKSLFEGFNNGDAHRVDFNRYGLGLNQKILPPDQYKEMLAQLPPTLRKSVELGRIQQAIDDFRHEIRRGMIPLKRGETLIGKLVDLERISEEDKRSYEDVLARSRYNFEIAFQMQGVTQEKAVRGGGVLFVDRNRYVQEYQKVREADDSKLSFAGKRSQWNDDQWLGWILSELKMGKRLDVFTDEEKYLYYGFGTIDKDGKFEFSDQAIRNLVKSGTFQRLAPVDRKRLVPTDRKEYKDEVSFHLAVKFVQAGVNWTKMYYRDDAAVWDRPDLAAWCASPNFRACFRSAVVSELQDMAIDQLVVNGYQARLEYVDFEVTSFDPKTKKITVKPIVNPRTQRMDVKPMTLKRPRGVINADGKMDVQSSDEVHLDFDKAVDSYLALHTTHSYWAYQNNNTHTLVPDYVFDQARKIRDGKLRWEDADILAGLLLTVDPTLTRVKGFPGDQMSLEGIVFDAAVEDSYMSWIKVRNGIKDRFLPRDGNPEHMDMGYYIEDFGGESRFALQIECLVAKMPKRWARRFAAALAITPIHASTMADNLGRKGVLGAVSMMADKINDLSGQRILGQFGITKFINMVDAASELWFSLVGGIDPKTGLHHEGIFMKPTSNNDKLVQYWDVMRTGNEYPKVINSFLYELKETFSRVEATLKIIRKMYSDNRNAGGALDLSKTDIFLPDGRYNPEIAKDRNTGSSRHIAKMFWDAYVEWLLSAEPGGGVEAYEESAAFYKFLKKPYHYYDGSKVASDPNRTWADWLFDKMAL